MITSSVILCTRNRPNDLINCLLSLALQTQLPQELIIIDSSDQLIEKNEHVKAFFNQTYFAKTKLVYRHTKPGLTYQRNIGISLATQDIIYFFDDDTILEPSYIQEMNHAFMQYPHYIGGMGTITNLPPRNIARLVRSYFQQIFLLQRNYASGNFNASGIPTHAYGTKKFKTVQVLGGCCMAFRAAIVKKHLFDENLVGYAFMEDCDISWRVLSDGPLFYNPSARLQHLESPSAREKDIELRAMYIKYYSYLFFKNFYPLNNWKIVAYIWSVTGLFLEALLMGRINFIKGYAKGLKQYYCK